MELLVNFLFSFTKHQPNTCERDSFSHPLCECHSTKPFLQNIMRLKCIFMLISSCGVQAGEGSGGKQGQGEHPLHSLYHKYRTTQRCIRAIVSLYKYSWQLALTSKYVRFRVAFSTHGLSTERFNLVGRTTITHCPPVLWWLGGGGQTVCPLDFQSMKHRKWWPYCTAIRGPEQK